jgi:hypothetical protein
MKTVAARNRGPQTERANAPGDRLIVLVLVLVLVLDVLDSCERFEDEEETSDACEVLCRDEAARPGFKELAFLPGPALEV